MKYEPTWESVSQHAVPAWYDDAKLGVFLHWGLYSVPGWAPQVADIQELLRTQGPEGMLKNNPYAEWYRNTMQVPNSPTRLHHEQTYGANFDYDAFVEPFNEQSALADLDSLASLCRQAGAGYVVLTTKHHEGFTLWPASIPHPNKGFYHADRDLVGDLTQAVKAQGMRMGLYYSGGYDWPYNNAVMTKTADSMLAVPAAPDYVEYATAHVKEIIDRYQPSVLWNDICWPAGGDLAELFAYYYNAVPDGVINDRWLEPSANRSAVADALTRGSGDVIQGLWKFIPDKYKTLTFPSANHFDFTTPEYAQFDEIVEKKWEATRGVGHSFGANRNERPQDIVTATELIRMLCDVVAKNGNLLIGIGPNPNGIIPAEQTKPLAGLGEWLAINGEAIRGTRPWHSAETTTTENTPVRFTRNAATLFALLIDTPGRRTFGLRDFDPVRISAARLLGSTDELEWTVTDGLLTVTLPERLPVSAAQVIAMTYSG